MTAIVGLCDAGKVYIGGDSAGVEWEMLEVRADEKVFINGDFLFGFTSSFRMGQLLQYTFRPPPKDPAMEVFAYMATSFIEEVRTCLRRGGFSKREFGKEEGGSFLVGYQGRLFQIADDFQIGELVHGFDAVGCGQMIARGALYASSHIKDPRKRVLLALKAAQEFSGWVREPFVVKSI